MEMGRSIYGAKEVAERIRESLKVNGNIWSYVCTLITWLCFILTKRLLNHVTFRFRNPIIILGRRLSDATSPFKGARRTK